MFWWREKRRRQPTLTKNKEATECRLYNQCFSAERHCFLRRNILEPPIFSKLLMGCGTSKTLMKEMTKNWLMEWTFKNQKRLYKVWYPIIIGILNSGSRLQSKCQLEMMNKNPSFQHHHFLGLEGANHLLKLEGGLKRHLNAKNLMLGIQILLWIYPARLATKNLNFQIFHQKKWALKLLIKSLHLLRNLLWRSLSLIRIFIQKDSPSLTSQQPNSSFKTRFQSKNITKV